MGTSSRYDGPKGKNPLIPDDYTPEKEKKENLDEKIDRLKWKDSKTKMAEYFKNETTGEKVVSSYIKALGGAKKAASSSSVAKRATIALGNFLSGVSSNGVKSYLEQNKIEYQNRSVEDVLSDVANLLSPTGGTKEESFVREAIFNIMGDLYESIIENDGDIGSLDNLKSETFNEIMNKFLSEIIFQRLIKDLGSREEMAKKTEKELINLEGNIKLYIQGTVENVLSENNYINYNYLDKSINGTIEKLYSECYEALEGAI